MGNNNSDLVTKLKAIARTNAHISFDISENGWTLDRKSGYKRVL